MLREDATPFEISELKKQVILGEDSRRQFKADLRNADSLAAEMAAFANCEGGAIFIGVADDGSLPGLSNKDVSRINQILAYSPPQKRASLFYWHREAHASNAEVDYLLAGQGDIIPVEVKSGATGTLRSLHLFLKEKSSVSPHGIRFSGHNFSIHQKIHSCPLYAVSNLFRDGLRL